MSLCCNEASKRRRLSRVHQLAKTRVGKMDFPPRYMCFAWKKHFTLQHVSYGKKHFSRDNHVNDVTDPKIGTRKKTSWKTKILRVVGDDQERWSLFREKRARLEAMTTVISEWPGAGIVLFGERLLFVWAWRSVRG